MKSYAKINLFLDVLGKRDDGYHDIFSIMQTVSLYDELTFSFNDSFAFEIKTPQINLPADEKNIIVKAAKLLIKEYGLPTGIKIELEKRIPIGAGLAGGSSNCATTLLGINALFDLKIPMEKLIEIGKSLGADVPFCLTGGTAIVEGIGEKITPLPPHPPCYIVIACPKIHVSTKDIFDKLDTNNFKKADPNEILEGLSKNNPEKVASSLYNIFTPVTSGLHPQITDLIAQFKELGAQGAEMSGTGASVFAYFKEEKIALRALNKIKKSVTDVFICTPKEGRALAELKGGLE